MKIALVHDWLTGMRGGEYVLEAIAEIFPKAEIFTLIAVPGTMSPQLTLHKRHTSFLQKVPQVEERYRYFLPVMPVLAERFDLRGFDLVLSSSHCVAKGVRKPAGAVHVSYVHAPMRYMWDRYDDYFGAGRASLPVRLAAWVIRKRMQRWDRDVSGKDRIDFLIANSHYIERQIRENYGREARVVFPFADLRRFMAPRRPGKNYLMVGAFAPNKRVDIAVEAFTRLKLPLLIVGSGQDEARLKKMAGPTIDFLGSVSNAAIADLYSKCRAFVFPGQDDFGITPVEAMSAGVPVIAYGAGGVLDTVTEKTGILYRPQTVEGLMQAVMKLERGEVSFDEEDCRERASQFSRERFRREYFSAVQDAWVSAGRDPTQLLQAANLGE